MFGKLSDEELAFLNKTLSEAIKDYEEFYGKEERSEDERNSYLL